MNIEVEESGVPEDATSVRAIWKNHLGTVISDQTRTTVDISTTASDGGAITITDETGTGVYRATYTPPNDGTYTPPAAGLQFSVQIIATDEDGTADTGAVSFYVIPADVTISIDSVAVASVVKRRTGLLVDVHVPGENVRDTTRTKVDLGKGQIYAIDNAYKNGIAIVRPTNYTWNLYGSLATLVVAATDADEYLFRVQRRLSDDALNDFIDESSNLMLSALRPFYGDTLLASRPTFEALVVMRTVGKVKIELTKGSRDNSDSAEGAKLVQQAEEWAKSIARGEKDLLDSSDAIVSRREGALAGGFRSADGAITGRLDLVDRFQKWTGILQEYWPETAPSLIVSPRSL